MLWYSIECPQEKQKAASTSSAELNIHHAILGGQFLMYKCLATWYLRYEKRLSICKNKISWITMKTVLGTLWVIMHRIKYSLETPRLKLINITIENHAGVYLAEILFYFQGLLYADPKCASRHRNYAWSLSHKIHKKLQIPNLETLAYTGCIDPLQRQGQIMASTTLHAIELS
jgi:hypothetical protein